MSLNIIENKNKDASPIVDVIVCRVGQPAFIERLEDRLDAYRAVCGGDIEGWTVGPNLALLCNGEGVHENLAPNRFHTRLGVIRGDFIVAKTQGGETSNASLEDLDHVNRVFQVLIRPNPDGDRFDREVAAMTPEQQGLTIDALKNAFQRNGIGENLPVWRALIEGDLARATRLAHAHADQDIAEMRRTLETMDPVTRATTVLTNLARKAELEAEAVPCGTHMAHASDLPCVLARGHKGPHKVEDGSTDGTGLVEFARTYGRPTELESHAAKARRYPVSYTVRHEPAGKSRAELEAEHQGGADAVVLISLLTQGGGLSMNMVSVDGEREGADLDPEVLFKVWGLLAHTLSVALPAGGRAKLCTYVHETIRQAVLGQVKFHDGLKTSPADAVPGPETADVKGDK